MGRLKSALLAAAVAAWLGAATDAAVAQRGDIGTPSGPSQDIGTPGAPAQDVGTPRAPAQDVGTPAGPAHDIVGPPMLCGPAAAEIDRLVQTVREWGVNAGSATFNNLADIASQFSPRVEDLVMVDETQRSVPPNAAWRAPGVRTLAEGSEMGCVQAAIAQELRWKTGRPFVAKARVVDVPGVLSQEIFAGSGRRSEGEILRGIFGSPTPILRRYGYPERSYAAPGWLQLFTKQAVDIVISDDAKRGGHPRGVVGLEYNNSPVGHAVNVRWNADAGRVEYWDASAGAPADLTNVKSFWLFPTN